MKSKKWIMADDNGKYTDMPVPFSGPKGLLGGFDARNRAAKRLDKPGSHVPAMKESKETPRSYKTPLRKMGEPAPVRKWTKKYL